MATKNRKTDREEEREGSLTGVTPKLADLKIGQVLTSRKVRGKSHTGTAVAEAGVHLLKVAGKTWRSLSAAGSSITGLACRGGTFWNLLPMPRYDLLAATPAPRRPAKKAAKKRSAKATKKTAKKPSAQTALDSVLLPTFQQMRDARGTGADVKLADAAKSKTRTGKHATKKTAKS